MYNLRPFYISQSTEGLHLFSANLTSRSTAFERFVKFSIVAKKHKPIVSLGGEKKTKHHHTRFFQSLGTAFCKLSCPHFITQLEDKNSLIKYIQLFFYVSV